MSDKEFKKLARELAGKQRHSSSILLLVVITLISVVFVWAAVSEIDSVIRGSGKTVSEAQNQLVQSSEPGVIRKRYVSEGDFVEEGELYLISSDRCKNKVGSSAKKIFYVIG